jgi:hypothetical protein
MSERAAPFYCPYCGDEDLEPFESTGGAWHCRSCTRAFKVSFLGLTARDYSSHPLTEGTHQPDQRHDAPPQSN